MAAKIKIQRLTGALIVLAILVILVWQLAPGFFYPVVIIAVLIASTAFLLIFRKPPGTAGTNSPAVKAATGQSQPSQEKPPSREPTEPLLPISPDDSLPKIYQRGQIMGNVPDTIQTADIAARYHTTTTDTRVDNSTLEKLTGKAVIEQAKPVEVKSTENKVKPSGNPQPSGNSSPEDAMPITEDQSSLSQEEKNRLVNAVWYRCENPYCKYTHFLDVHHIIEEKDGGANTLDNLIVLCPYCHDLAHKKEIPEYTMREWIANREERFRFHLDWPY
jgi:5-methylcytosine-specific restriction endonuclease McrA